MLTHASLADDERGNLYPQTYGSKIGLTGNHENNKNHTKSFYKDTPRSTTFASRNNGDGNSGQFRRKILPS